MFKMSFSVMVTSAINDVLVTGVENSYLCTKAVMSNFLLRVCDIICLDFVSANKHASDKKDITAVVHIKFFLQSSKK